MQRDVHHGLLTSEHDRMPAAANQRFTLALRMLAGPLAFLSIYVIPMEGLDSQAHVGLGCYAWVLVWWAAMPVPWAVTAFLPLVLFPIGGVMPFRDVSGLYGQRIFPFVLGVMLFGHAFRKHGLAKRMAVHVLSLPGVAPSGSRLVLMIHRTCGRHGTPHGVRLLAVRSGAECGNHRQAASLPLRARTLQTPLRARGDLRSRNPGVVRRVGSAEQQAGRCRRRGTREEGADRRYRPTSNADSRDVSTATTSNLCSAGPLPGFD